MRTSARVVWALSLLLCLVAILLLPGSATVVRTHGKHTVRVISLHSLLTLASVVIYRDLLRPPDIQWAAGWQAIRGNGSQLLHGTCVLRC